MTEENTKAEILEAYQEARDKAREAGIALPSGLSGLNKSNNKGDLLSALSGLEALLKEKPAESRKREDIDVGVQISIEDADIAVKNRNNRTTESFPVSERGQIKQSAEEKTIKAEKREEEALLLNRDILRKMDALKAVLLRREEELSTLLALEKGFASLAIDVNTKRQEMMSIEKRLKEQMDEKEECLREKLESVERESKSRIEQAETAISEEKERIEQQKRIRDEKRAEEEENYQYERSVACKKEDDLWEDEARKRKQILNTVTDEILLLEKTLEEKELLVPSLDEKLNELPELLREAEKEGFEKMEKELTEEYSHRRSLAKRDAEASAATLETQIQNLRSDYEDLLTEKDAIEAKLDKAYEDSNRLYLQTVQSTGGIKILGGAEGIKK